MGFDLLWKISLPSLGGEGNVFKTRKQMLVDGVCKEQHPQLNFLLGE